MTPDSKVALITGGAKRIGYALCENLHQQGYAIVLHYHRSHEHADELTRKLNGIRNHSAKAVQADLNDLSQVLRLARKATEAFGRMDVLINNASSFYPTPLSVATESNWNDLMNTNAKAPYFLSQALHPALLHSRGCIINMVDIFSEKPMPNHSLYSMAKAANRMMVMALAAEWAPEVRVNGIAPGAILWPELASANEITKTEKLARIPLGKLGGVAPIQQAVDYLIHQAPFTTGQILTLDGGQSLRMC